MENDKATKTEVLDFLNHDLQKIVTPVKADILQDLLLEAGYKTDKIKFLWEGFTYGFDLNYEGPLHNVVREAPNLKLRVGSKVELWNKVMSEVKLGRYVGPFKDPPFDKYVKSPIGLVPKDKGKKTRLIFHLSFPKDGDSINSGIPHEKCTVQYPYFTEAVQLCLTEGVS